MTKPGQRGSVGRWMLGALLAAAALVSGGCGSQALQTRTPPKSLSTARHTVFFNCAGNSAVAPAVIVLACADAGEILKDMNWQGWGNPTATTSGAEYIQGCNPNCAAGKLYHRPIVANVSGLKLVGTHASYSVLRIWKLPRPRGASPVAVFDLTSNGPALSEAWLKRQNAKAAKQR